MRRAILLGLLVMGCQSAEQCADPELAPFECIQRYDRLMSQKHTYPTPVTDPSCEKYVTFWREEFERGEIESAEILENRRKQLIAAQQENCKLKHGKWIEEDLQNLNGQTRKDGYCRENKK